MTGPTYSQAAELDRLMNEASNRFNDGDITGADEYCLRALGIYPKFHQALYLQGLCHWQRGDLTGAANSIYQALELSPRDPQMFHDLGSVLFEMGFFLDAARAALQAIELRPDFADSYINLGAAYENLGHYSDAERAYQRALEIDPRSAPAAASLAALCESGNRIEEAQQLVTMALEVDPDEVVANLTLAQLNFRAERYEETVDRLEAVLKQALSPRNRSLALARLGAALEMLGKYDDAFTAFRSSKDILMNSDSPIPKPGIYSLTAVERVASHAPQIFVSQPELNVSEDESPVFLVGFPRSGTTLLDQMLSSHPELVVLEEKENLRDLLQEFATTDAGLDRFAQLTNDELLHYRQQYWARVAENISLPHAGGRFVDKLPLNTIFMPLIARLFPGARFIFAVRDPRDVVLSCFMRAFGLNEAMWNFLSLEGTARFYAAVMGVGVDSMQRIGQSVHVIRYEMLIEDVEKEARRLCGFLGLPWDDAMLKFQEIARNRRINTPSYHQVIKPIYTSARERWRNYEQYLKQVLPILQPFLDRFGYQ